MKKTILSVSVVVILIALLIFAVFFGLNLGLVNVEPLQDGITLGLDLVGGSEITYEAVVPESMTAEELKQAMEAVQTMLRQRLNSMGYTEGVVVLSGDRGVNVSIPNVSNPEQALQMLGTTAVIEFRDHTGKAIITGEDIESATAAYMPAGTGGVYEYIVSLKLTEAGREKFREGTRAVASLSDPDLRWIAIVLDEEVISSPTVSTEYASTGIDTDSPIIQLGESDVDYATYLAGIINSGSLPFELKDTKLQAVGASLGERSLETGIRAGIIGIILVMIFMIVVYRIPGVIADLALILYIALFLVVMSALRLNLSLPGIAGIILTVGMAVDANIVIYERIREELISGKTLRSAVDAGFKRAITAILDSNITTMIAGFVLLWKGTGTILGFAKTLLIGVVLSMICMLIVPRAILRSLSTLRKYNPFLYGLPAKGASPESRDRRIGFVKKGKLAAVISLVLCVTAIVSLVLLPFGVNLFNLDIDFVGGVVLEYDIGQTVTGELSAEIADRTAELTGIRPSSVVKAGDRGTIVNIRIQELTTEQRDAVGTWLGERFGPENVRLESSNFVSASVGRDITKAAFITSIVAAVLILVYITVRFEIRSGLAAVVCLIHDLLVMLSFYVIFRVQLNMNFIAAALTIIGYSINATIVVFDRIRENVKRTGGHEDFAAVVDRSITQTLRRSIGTTITTMLPIIFLLLLGVSSLRNFALPILVGVISGCYSSVCVAGPLWNLLKGKKKAVKVK
ncbi:MAG: protein translocase subunit SecD [Oscillospiraceae bacterium]|nr:protein translocase subunit SecD [Oscillospiraceae bacterium]